MSEKARREFLFTSELFILLVAALTFAVYYRMGIPLRQPLNLYSIRILGNSALYFAGLFVVLLIWRLRDIAAALRAEQKLPFSQTVGTFRAKYLNSTAVLRDLRYVNLLSVTFVAFIHAKHLIPFVSLSGDSSRKVLDYLFVNSERELFGGELAVSIFQRYFGHGAAPFLSESYTLFYGYVACLTFLFIFLRDRALKEEFFSSFVLVWFVGLALVFMWPTWGPCFFLPETVSALPPTKMAAIQARLWQMKLALDMEPLSASKTYFISGFPSLHFAVVLLGTLYLRKISWILTAISSVFLVLTFISTIYFGWHYLWDDLAALPLVLACIVGSKLLNSGHRSE